MIEYSYSRINKTLDPMLQCNIESQLTQWIHYMNLTRKNHILLIIIGILVSGIPLITLCSSYCGSSDFEFYFDVGGSCPFSYDLFVKIAIVLSALFVLPLAGFFIAEDRQFIPPGVYWPLFKPPRFSHWENTTHSIHLIKLNLSQAAWKFKILAVSIDSLGANAVAPFMKKHNLTFQILIDSTGIILTTYGVNSIPYQQGGTCHETNEKIFPPFFNSTDSFIF